MIMNSPGPLILENFPNLKITAFSHCFARRIADETSTAKKNAPVPPTIERDGYAPKIAKLTISPIARMTTKMRALIIDPPYNNQPSLTYLSPRGEAR